MIRENTSDFIEHPLLCPHMGPPTMPGFQVAHHLNPALENCI